MTQASNDGELSAYPPFEEWGEWSEWDAKKWPEKVERTYSLHPTICFNCEAGCGLLCYVDHETGQISRIEGNPRHPGSRGRNCAKGPATLSQLEDPDRILHPLKRVGKRGAGKFEEVGWDEVLDDLAGRITTAFDEGRHDEVMYHVGRPGHDGTMDRVLKAWGIDGHNSHTNVCSGAARLGYSLWSGDDRPSPDYENARFMLLISAHLETGHYFNPHAQRIMDAKSAGAKIAVVDARLSNTASMADHWLAPWPGTEAAMLLAIAHEILSREAENREFLERWVNWEQWLASARPEGPRTFPAFLDLLREQYREWTPETAEAESGVPAAQLREVADGICDAGTAFSSHVWRSAASGNLGGWQVARCLYFLQVLMGAVGTVGGVAPNRWNKFVPKAANEPPPHSRWNEVIWPKQWPLSHHELSFLLPHLLREQGRRIDTYFTRVYNPVWTNPDGGSWLEMLADEDQVGCHVALTPTWNETAFFADYVLPMGHSTERHDLMSQETHAGRWIGFRQPVMRVHRERAGESFDRTSETNPGEVWEEDEFWTELSWRMDPDGERGIRQHFESPYREGERITASEHYRWMFENSVPGLPEAAAAEGMEPLEYMRRVGAFAVPGETTMRHEEEVDDGGGVDMGDGTRRRGFETPSGRLEIYSSTMAEWGWEDQTLPGYIESHVHPSKIDSGKSEYLLLPTFRLPNLIHTRSGNAKWLYEISHTNPLWLHPQDAERIGVATGDAARVATDIGHFVVPVWVTEGLRPGVVACSHHLGRWRLKGGPQAQSWSSSEVDLSRKGSRVSLRVRRGPGAYKSDDPDSSRVFWTDGGVHQNLTFPVHPDPISGMHCWHQKVVVTPAQSGDKPGDVSVDTAKSRAVYEQWRRDTKPAPGPGGLRRPLHFLRPLKPTPAAYRLDPESTPSAPAGV